MTEWWQKDEGDVPVPIPRRDVVPGAGFSDPRTVNPAPEVTFFVPEWRIKRRKIAIGATAIAVGFFSLGVVVLVRAATADDPETRRLGMVQYLFIVVMSIASVLALVAVWRWANERDPRDTQDPIAGLRRPGDGYAGLMSLDLGLPVGDLTRRLLEVDSVSGNEGPLADLVEEAFRGLPHLDVTRDGDAIIARTHLGRAERVAIAGHLDTVPLAEGLRVKVEGDTLWGRGAVDMKGGVAVILSLAATLVDPKRDVTWILYDHEEVADALNGLGRISRTNPDLLKVDFAVLAEPTAGRIEGGCNGTLRFEVVVPGTTAHSARAWKGVNAIHQAAPVLVALARYSPQVVTVDGLEYREGLNAVAVAAGIAGNIIPDRCMITINYRYAPDKTEEQAVAHVREVLDESGVEGLTMTVVDHGASCRPGLDAPIARDFVGAVSAMGAGEPRAKYAWTDVARFGTLGIPAVNYGPGDPNLAHSDGERVSIAEIEQVREGLRVWLEG